MNSDNIKIYDEEQQSPTFNQERTAVFNNLDINEVKESSEGSPSRESPTKDSPTKERMIKKPKVLNKKKNKTPKEREVEDEKGIKKISSSLICTVDEEAQESKPKRAGQETPKFGKSLVGVLKKSKYEGIELTGIQVDANNSNEDKNGMKPDNTILSDDEDFDDMRPKNVKYKENLLRGLNVISYLKDRRVPAGNKVFYIFIILLILGSFGANMFDFIIYAKAPGCSEDLSNLAMYFNLFVIFFTKIGLFSYITSEINKNLDYDLKFPFIVPVLAIGVLANLQLPIVVCNYQNCDSRNTFIKVPFAAFVVNATAILLAAVIVSILAGLIIFMRCKLPHNLVKGFKTVVSFVAIDLMLIMNCMFLIVTFSQIDKFSPSLLAENIVYWTLIVSGSIIFFIQKKYKKEIFTALENLETEGELRSKDQITYDQTPQQQEYEMIDAPLSTDRRRIQRMKLEKIDENEEEDEKSQAVSKINPRKYIEENVLEQEVVNGKKRPSYRK